MIQLKRVYVNPMQIIWKIANLSYVYFPFASTSGDLALLLKISKSKSCPEQSNNAKGNRNNRNTRKALCVLPNTYTHLLALTYIRPIRIRTLYVQVRNLIYQPRSRDIARTKALIWARARTLKIISQSARSLFKCMYIRGGARRVRCTRAYSLSAYSAEIFSLALLCALLYCRALGNAHLFSP